MGGGASKRSLQQAEEQRDAARRELEAQQCLARELQRSKEDMEEGLKREQTKVAEAMARLKTEEAKAASVQKQLDAQENAAKELHKTKHNVDEALEAEKNKAADADRKLQNAEARVETLQQQLALQTNETNELQRCEYLHNETIEKALPKLASTTYDDVIQHNLQKELKSAQEEAYRLRQLQSISNARELQLGQELQEALKEVGTVRNEAEHACAAETTTARQHMQVSEQLEAMQHHIEAELSISAMQAQRTQSNLQAEVHAAQNEVLRQSEQNRQFVAAAGAEEVMLRVHSSQSARSAASAQLRAQELERDLDNIRSEFSNATVLYSSEVEEANDRVFQALGSSGANNVMLRAELSVAQDDANLERAAAMEAHNKSCELADMASRVDAVLEKQGKLENELSMSMTTSAKLNTSYICDSAKQVVIQMQLRNSLEAALAAKEAAVRARSAEQRLGEPLVDHGINTACVQSVDQAVQHEGRPDAQDAATLCTLLAQRDAALTLMAEKLDDAEEQQLMLIAELTTSQVVFNACGAHHDGESCTGGSSVVQDCRNYGSAAESSVLLEPAVRQVEDPKTRNAVAQPWPLQPQSFVQYEGTDPAEKTLAIPAVDKVGSFAYTTGDPNAVQLCDLLAERDAQISAMAEELREAEADNVMAIAHLATTNALDTGANWAAQSAVIEAMSQQLEEAEEQARYLESKLVETLAASQAEQMLQEESWQQAAVCDAACSLQEVEERQQRLEDELREATRKLMLEEELTAEADQLGEKLQDSESRSLMLEVELSTSWAHVGDLREENRSLRKLMTELKVSELQMSILRDEYAAQLADSNGQQQAQLTQMAHRVRMAEAKQRRLESELNAAWADAAAARQLSHADGRLHADVASHFLWRPMII